MLKNEQKNYKLLTRHFVQCLSYSLVWTADICYYIRKVKLVVVFLLTQWHYSFIVAT